MNQREREANLKKVEAVNLELLRTFLVAALAPTFAEAGRRRGVSVSAVSQQIKALETQLGVRLFERLGRRVKLSAEGRTLLDDAGPHLQAVAEAIERVGGAVNVVQGVVRLGSPRTFWQVQLKPAVAPLLERWPALQLEVRFEVPSVLERRLADGELDLAMLGRPTELPGLVGEPFAQETFVAVASPRYLARHGTPRTEAEFRQHRFIVFDADRPMHTAWWRAAFGARSQPGGTIVCSIASLEEMASLADAGVGLTVIPDYLLSLWRRLVTVLPEGEARRPRPAHNTLFLCRRGSAVETERVKVVREALFRQHSSPKKT